MMRKTWILWCGAILALPLAATAQQLVVYPSQVSLDNAHDFERLVAVVTRPDGVQHAFEIDAFRKHCLLHGLDDIGLTLQESEAIRAFEARHRAAQRWLFDAGA